MTTKFCLVKRKLFLTFLIIYLVFVTTACNGSQKTEPVEKSNFALNTIITIQAYGPHANEAIDKAFERILEVEEKMTTKDDLSEVNMINKKAGEGFQAVSTDTFFVIKKGMQYSESTNGIFDITVGPLVKLWGIGTDEARIPSNEEINLALKLVDYRKVELNENENSVFLKTPGMAIDLGGIAKGFAADEVVRILKENGVESAIADLGGNLYVIGSKPNGMPWNIGIQNPFNIRGSIFATVQVSDKTLVSSGPYERYFEENGETYHHILDTRTGFPVDNGLMGITIISDSSIDADALSTSVFALGLVEGMKFIEEKKGVDAVFVTSDYMVYTTSGIEKYNFEITDEQFTFVE
jgi:thiamine biosynthesis lipoprotein